MVSYSHASLASKWYLYRLSRFCRANSFTQPQILCCMLLLWTGHTTEKCSFPWDGWSGPCPSNKWWFSAWPAPESAAKSISRSFCRFCQQTQTDRPTDRSLTPFRLSTIGRSPRIIRLRPIVTVGIYCRTSTTTMFMVLSSSQSHYNHAIVEQVHLMNAYWSPRGRQPSDRANRLGLSVQRNSRTTTF